MHPELFSIGSFTIHTYGFMIMTGAVLGFIYMSWTVNKELGISRDKIQNLNVKSAFVMTQKSLPMLEAAASAADPARVINITSVAGQMYGSMQAYAYGPSKAALNHLTKILAGELAAKHITVNAIAPGVFPSRMTTFVLKDEKMAEQQRNAVPLGRLGEPEDMEGLAVFLSSQAGAYITGNVIALDGGTAVKSPDIL